MWISENKLRKIKNDSYMDGINASKEAVKVKTELSEIEFKRNISRLRTEIMMEIAQEKANSIIVENSGCGITSYIYVLDDIDSIIMKYNTAIHEKSKFIFVTYFNGLTKSVNVDGIIEIKENKKQTL